MIINKGCRRLLAAEFDVSGRLDEDVYESAEAAALVAKPDLTYEQLMSTASVCTQVQIY